MNDEPKCDSGCERCHPKPFPQQELLDKALAAIRKQYEDLGYCALCDGHHYPDDPPCPIAPNVSE
jgi:hypothetical protein